jgi:hypothetical protein
VGYVTSRSELLSAALLLGALLCLRQVLAAQRWRWLAPGLLCWLLAIAAKETGAVLPLLLLAYDWLLLRPSGQSSARVARWVHLPSIGLIVLGGTIRLASYATAEASGMVELVGRNLLTQANVTWRYLRLLIIPVGQSIMHGIHEVDRSRLLGAVVAAAGIIVLLVASWRLRNKRPLVPFGVLWFLLCLAPSSLIPLVEPMAEHRLYLPAAGAVLALVSLAWWSIEHFSVSRPSVARVARLVAVALVLLLAGATVARNRVWDSGVSVWRDAVAKAPSIVEARQSLADAYRLAGDCRGAIPHYRKTLEFPLYSAPVRSSLGTCLAVVGDYVAAERVFRDLLAHRPEYPGVHLNLAMLATIGGRVEEARRLLTRAVELNPQDEKARRQLEALSAVRQR